MGHPNLTPTDTQLLDFLQRMTRPGERWIARHSSVDRGYRLHVSTSPDAVPDVRDALILGMARDE